MRVFSPRYSIRSLEANAPWIHHIYIVTNGQIPSWLDLSNPKISVVFHKDIFRVPHSLPTFSSPAIELNLHHIPHLSDYFIYFNDDVFLGQPVHLSDFISLQRGQKLFASWLVPDCSDRCPLFSLPSLQAATTTSATANVTPPATLPPADSTSATAPPATPLLPAGEPLSPPIATASRSSSSPTSPAAPTAAPTGSPTAAATRPATGPPAPSTRATASPAGKNRLQRTAGMISEPTERRRYSR